MNTFYNIRYFGFVPMKFSMPQFQILPYLSNHTVLKYASTSPISEHEILEKTTIRTEKKPKALEKTSFQNLKSITGIAVAYNCISWAKISTSSMALSAWRSYALPDFQKPLNEMIILDIALQVAPSIPISDLYVLEGMTTKWYSNPNNISLKSMLMALLSSQDGNSRENLAVLDAKVLNRLHNLLIGGERISPKQIFEKKIRLQVTGGSQDNSGGNPYSRINILPEYLDLYSTYSEATQGGLSLAVLIALSCIDISEKTNYS